MVLRLKPMSSSLTLLRFPSLFLSRPALVKPNVLQPRYSTSTTLLRTFSVAYSSSSTVVPQVSHSSKSFDADLGPYLSCCMPNKRLRVAVLLSGGVDSSVALRLLHAAGHSCTAFYLKIWFQVCPLSYMPSVLQYWV